MAHQGDIPGNSKSEADILTGVPVEAESPRIAPPGLSRLSHKVQRNLEDYGWRIAVKKSVAYLIRAIYFQQAYRIYRIDLDDAGLPPDSNPHNFTFKILTVQNVDMIADVEDVAEWLRGQLKKNRGRATVHGCVGRRQGRRVQPHQFSTSHAASGESSKETPARRRLVGTHCGQERVSQDGSGISAAIQNF
jgi:hypothetical protein